MNISFFLFILINITLFIYIHANPKEELILLQKTFISMSKKLHNEINSYNLNNIPVTNRNLIIFHINEVTQEKDSVDISYNNLQIFLSSIKQHKKESKQKAFYIFNIAGGITSNFQRYIPLHQNNVAYVDWPRRCGEKDTPIKTILQLGSNVYSNFTSVVITSDRSRGPMYYTKNGEWIDKFRFLLDRNNVGIVGASMSCEQFPHIQPHMYMFRTELLTNAIKAYNIIKKTNNMNIIQYFHDGISVIAVRLGYKLASMLYYTRKKELFYQDQCLEPTTSSSSTINPLTWCDLLPEEVVFVKWGGVPLRPPTTICIDHLNKVQQQTTALAVNDPTLQLHLPETFHRGLMYELRKQYNMEIWRDNYITSLLVHRNTTTTSATIKDSSSSVYATALVNPRVYMTDIYTTSKPKVCILVTVNARQDSTPLAKAKSIFETIDVEQLVHSLLRQTNPNWKAFFLVQEETAQFHSRVLAILSKFDDVRLRLLPETSKSLSVAALLDLLTATMAQQEDCVYVSAAPADTIYGSHIVHTLLYASNTSSSDASSSSSSSSSGGAAEILLVPYDSRATAEHEHQLRTSLRPSASSSWLDACINFEAMFSAHLMPYTIQPNIMVGRIDLSAIFLLKDALLSGNIQFGTIGVENSRELQRCPDCQSGLIMQYLASVKQWQALRLPIDGLKSVILRQPSPTLCVATGNVWFDYPVASKTGCLSLAMLQKIQEHDHKEKPLFDWKYTYSRYKTCLRLSEHGYAHNENELFFN